MTYLEFKTNKMFWFDLIGLFPFLVVIVLLVVSLFNGIVFSVSDNKNIVTGPLYLALHLTAFVYFLIIIVFAIIKIVKGRDNTIRRYAITTIFGIVFLTGWVIIDDYFDRITIIPVAAFSVLLIIFISIQQSSINTDALTQMNNRRRAIDFFYSLRDTMNQNSPVYLFLCDINSFKEINDTYGHGEGDEALIIVSGAIKDVLAKYRGFSARYGGDEFLMIWKKPQNEVATPTDIIEETRDIIDKKCFDSDKPYHLSISCGVVQCTDSKKTIDMYMREVDEALYEDKRVYHAKKKKLKK